MIDQRPWSATFGYPIIDLTDAATDRHRRARRVADRAVAASVTDVRTGGLAGVHAAHARLKAAAVRTMQIERGGNRPTFTECFPR